MSKQAQVITFELSTDLDAIKELLLDDDILLHNTIVDYYKKMPKDVELWFEQDNIIVTEKGIHITVYTNK